MKKNGLTYLWVLLAALLIGIFFQARKHINSDKRGADKKYAARSYKDGCFYLEPGASVRVQFPRRTKKCDFGLGGVATTRKKVKTAAGDKFVELYNHTDSTTLLCPEVVTWQKR